MDLHDLLSAASIVLELIAIPLLLLEVTGHRIRDLFKPRGARQTPVSGLKRLILTTLLIGLFTSALMWFMVDNTVWTVINHYYRELLYGLARTLGVSFLAILFGTLLGSISACLIAAETRSPLWSALKTVLESSIYLLLALPVIVIIYITYYSSSIGTLWIVATAALAINLSPFVAKIVAGSLRSIAKEQIDAARSFGYSEWQIIKYFKIKYVVLTSAQPLLVEYYTTIKLSSLTAYIGFAEVLHVSQDIIKDTQKPITAYAILALCYVVIVAPFALIVDYLEGNSRARRYD